MVAVGLLIAIAAALGLSALYGGFLFVLYWTAFCHAQMDKFVPALIGSFGGLALAYGLQALPAALGAEAGMALALVLVLLAIYFIIMGWLPILVNNAFMLFLTVGTIPALHEGTTLSAIGQAIVVAAIYTFILVQVGTKLASKGAGKAAPASELSA
ncbi:hypothetical protein MB02_02740 [Croceicoccus estronivorus]|nr:hypothetical protein MB02_02740 [Croceicoccus estronivorus]